MQLFRTTLGAARREGDELVVLDGTADVVEWAMSDDASSAVDPNTARITAILPAVLDVCTDDRHTVARYLVTTFGSYFALAPDKFATSNLQQRAVSMVAAWPVRPGARGPLR